MNDKKMLDSAHIADVSCPYCSKVTQGNVPTKPEDQDSLLSYSCCQFCRHEFRIKRYKDGSWIVDNWYRQRNEGSSGRT